MSGFRLIKAGPYRVDQLGPVLRRDDVRFVREVRDLLELAYGVHETSLSEAAALREQAVRDGYAEGFNQGLEALRELTEQLESRLAQSQSQLEAWTIDMVFALVGRVAIDIGPETFIRGMIRRAAQQMLPKRVLKVTVNPILLPALQAQFGSPTSDAQTLDRSDEPAGFGARALRFDGDESLGPFQCVLHGEDWEADASLAEQLAVIQQTVGSTIASGRSS